MRIGGTCGNFDFVVFKVLLGSFSTLVSKCPVTRPTRIEMCPTMTLAIITRGAFSPGVFNGILGSFSTFVAIAKIKWLVVE